jgi:hypothetical protein
MWKNLFKLDLRSLALARVCLGIVSFFDIGRRIWDLNHFFTDEGLLPRSILIDQYEMAWRMSLLNLNGTYSFALILLVAGMIASLFFTFGWRSRTSNLIVWLVIISFQARFPEGATSGGDMLLRIFLFWSLFLPMNSRYSVDHAISEKTETENEYFSVFSTMWIVQVFLLYFFTFLYKWAPVYHTTFEAVWYMLQLDIFTTPVGKWMGQQYELTRVLSFASYTLEIAGPLMLLIPFKRDWFRGAAVFSFWCFHLGIALTLHLGNFVPICLIIWVGLIPTAWWNYLEEKIKATAEETKTIYIGLQSEFSHRLVLICSELLFLNVKFAPSETPDKHFFANMLSGSRIPLIKKLGKFMRSDLAVYLTEVQEAGEVSIGKLSTTEPRGSKIHKSAELLFDTFGFEKIRTGLSKAEKVFGAFILALVVAWNFEGYLEPKKWYIGSPFDEIMFTLQIQQGWAMFAPHPQRSDGWWVMDGTLENGKKWDALNNKDVSFERPRDIYETFPSEDWRKFMDNLQGTRDDSYLLLLGRHLCRKWNSEHSEGEGLKEFQLYFMQEFTRPPQDPPAKVEKLKLWNHSCF